MTGCVSGEGKIVTIYCHNSEVLKKKTEDLLLPHDLSVARGILADLTKALSPYPTSAGLAAPQIGVSRSIFLYSCDRKHHEAAINPSYTPEGEDQQIGWEACFSAILGKGEIKIARLPRYTKIQAAYWNEEGVRIEKTLDGFGAKVFQHECDHLNGIVNIYHPAAIEVKSFASHDEFEDFMNAVRTEDSKSYSSEGAASSGSSS